MIRIKKEALLYDIANLAFVIADVNSSAEDVEAIHQTMDITQCGNLDRVARMMALAFSEAVELLEPVLEKIPAKSRITDSSARPHDFVVYPAVRPGGFLLENHARLIRDGIHEFIVCRVIADWLTVTIPKLAPVWREKVEHHRTALRQIAGEIIEENLHRWRGGPLRHPPFPVW